MFFDTGTSYERQFVKISLVAYANSTEDYSKTQNFLLPFGQAIANYWQPTKTWSPVIITIAEHGKTLIALVTTLLTATMVVAIIKNRREKRKNLFAYKKLISEEDKNIIKAVHKKKKAAFNIVASECKKLTGKTIQPERLLKKLEEAERAGLLERKTISRNGEPVLVWKSNTPLEL